MPAAAQLAEVERDQAALTNLCSSIAEAVPMRLGNSLLIMPAESLHFAIRDSFKAVLQRAAFVTQVSPGNQAMGSSLHLHLKQVECWCPRSAIPVRASTSDEHSISYSSPWVASGRSRVRSVAPRNSSVQCSHRSSWPRLCQRCIVGVLMPGIACDSPLDARL